MEIKLNLSDKQVQALHSMVEADDAHEVIGADLMDILYEIAAQVRQSSQEASDPPADERDDTDQGNSDDGGDYDHHDWDSDPDWGP